MAKQFVVHSLRKRAADWLRKHKRWLIVRAYFYTCLVCIIFYLFVGLTVYSDYTMMQENSQPQVLNDLRAQLGGQYNYTQLLVWEHEHLVYSTNITDRQTNAVDMLDKGKGMCGEFAVVYVTLCWAEGYQARLVTAALGDHQWTQVKINGTWVSIDPSLSLNDTRQINDPAMYQNDWHKNLMVTFAVGDNSFQDVAGAYTNSQIDLLSLPTIVMIVTVLVLFGVIIRWRLPR